MGEFTNVNSIDFQTNAFQPTTVTGSIQDPTSGTSFDIPSLTSLRPGLASQSGADLTQGNVASKQLRDSGLSVVEALIKAQAVTDGSSDAVTVSGELDALRYGDVLRARHLVGLRGVGQSYDGLYYVKKVVHTVSRCTYKQNFTLTREGLGSTVSTVIT
jgi:hypothetical protein